MTHRDDHRPTTTNPYAAPTAAPLQPRGAPTPPPAPTPAPARRRGPGWTGTVVVAVTAGLLSGGLTAGLGAFGQPSDAATSGTSASTTSAQTAAPASFDEPVTWGTVADRVSPSVVTITVEGQRGGGEGTGVVLDTGGHVVTNAHVATAGGPGAQITVTLADGRLYEATVTGTDPSTDLAVLELVDAPDDLEAASFGDSSAVAVGQPVMALGNPLGLSDTVTTGIISALDRPVVTPGSQGDPAVVTNALQTDASINPGNSGGALVDAAGRVIGINSSIAAPSAGGGTAGSVGLGFAIPANEAQRIATELVEDGRATHAQLGVTPAAAPRAATSEGTTRQSAVIAEVVAGSPADDAGLEVGDQVVAVDGVPTPAPDSLVALVRSHAPGDEVDLTVVRDGATEELTATLQQARR